MIPAGLIEANHIFFLLNLGLYAVLGSTFVWTLFHYLRLRRRGEAGEARWMAEALPSDGALPVVLVQLPTFNEGQLIRRIATAVAELDWPRNRLVVQILDDSTDGSEAETERAVRMLRDLGVEAHAPRRTTRRGFKAGALAEGLRLSEAPFVAVFDADYIPKPDFLKACMRPLIADQRMAFVQARCDFLNADQNVLTMSQQRILDAHYAVEQPARCWSGQILPFNGTCGIWRRAAIADAGGWQGDTLAEDMDLSYRVQLQGWRTLFLSGVTVPGELPSTFKAWRRQQFRWVKGTAEVTRKLFTSVWRSRLSLGVKLSSTLNLGGGLFGLLFGLSLVSGVIDGVFGRGLTPLALALLAIVLAEVVGGPLLLQVAAQKFVRGRSVVAEVARLPMVAACQVAVSLVNLGAGLEAVLGRGTDFERTPKAASAAGSAL
jgi:cellulose synthase/poly-beta-1,6-N-acetylglucosamine synthase-like glycosyltransferase